MLLDKGKKLTSIRPLCVGRIVTAMEALSGVEVRRIQFDKGYRGHDYPSMFRIWISGYVRRVI